MPVGPGVVCCMAAGNMRVQAHSRLSGMYSARHVAKREHGYDHDSSPELVYSHP